jgi:hypothetical protein
MKLYGLWRARLAQGLLGTAIVIALFLGARSSAQGPGNNPSHLPTDWSHRHMVFSPPTSFWQALELQNEPRYWHQWTRRNEWALRSANVHFEKNDRDRDGDRDHDRHDRDHDGDDAPASANDSLRRDWAMSLGANGTVGAGQFPAKFSFDVNATPSCTADYVAFTTSLAGSATVPSIVAFDNLYATQGSIGGFCNVNGPSVKWAYNTNPALDTTGTTLTSPVLSSDGTKIAFVESRTNANGGSILHILKWKPGAGVTVQGTIAAPATPDTLMAAGQAWNTTNCPAANSCVVNMIFNGAQPDTASAPYYNYVTDELYVGDNNGVLHKFTGVFLGTPTEVGAAGNWPITVNTGAILTGAVFDGTSKNIFVGDSTGHLSFVKEVGSATGACGAGSPPCLGGVSQALTGSIADAPYVDRSTGRVLVFDGTETSAMSVSGTANNGSIFQFDTALTAGSKVFVRIGGNAAIATAIVHGGAFDDAYFTLGPGSGHLYTCGKDPGFNNRPAIYQFSFTGPSPGPAGVLVTTGIPLPLKNLTTTFSLIGDACSPVTEIKNGATDRIFFGFATNANPPAGGTATGCTAGQGCVASINVSSFVVGGAGTWPPTATTAGIAAPFILTGAQTGSGGTSGIVVDNVGAGVQESSIYYTFQTNSTAAVTCNATTGVGCAVKVTQSALQ